MSTVTSEQQRQLSDYAVVAEFQAARRAEYIGFLDRHPYATDAYELGFAVGVREDYRFGDQGYTNVDLPVCILDNNFRDPDIDRYLETLAEYEPDVAILGDTYTADEAVALAETVDELRLTYPDMTTVAVPKCSAALDVFDGDVVVGYSMGYTNRQANAFSEVMDWRGRNVHLLGGSPPEQYAVIEKMTQPTLSSDPPANIVGMDWNGIHKVAYLGEAWHRDGWQPADHLSIRETVHVGLREIKQFWQARGIWPATEPIDRYGPAVREPDDPVYAATGQDIKSRGELEEAIVMEYGEEALAHQNETEQAFFEYREDL